MNLQFFKNKTVLTAISVSLLILILTIVLTSGEESPPPPTVAPTPVERPELVDLSRQRRQEAMIYVESIESKLPLYLAQFETSVGITTSINIYRLGDDEAEVVRLEIYGLSYLNSESDPAKNPNVTAFQESYLKAIEMIEGQNIDPKKLIFIYGDKEYVRTTTQAWLSALNLRP